MTGDLAYGEITSTAAISSSTTTAGVTTATAAASGSSNTTRAGWTIGAGAEWVLSSPWTAKLEYLYMDLGTFATVFTGVGAYPTLGISSHITDNIVRVGINYKFGGPVVAK